MSGMSNDEARMTNDEGMTKSENAFEHEARFWNDGLSVVREEPENRTVYELEERTARFGEAIIDFAKTIPQNPVTNRIIGQLVAAATSVGANYVEADDAVSKKEFLKNIGTCRKEARETKHFLRMVVRAVPELKTNRHAYSGPKRESFISSSRRFGGMRDDLRHSSFGFPSSFVIRHSSFSPCLTPSPSSK
jgi:four helix bundle protein